MLSSQIDICRQVFCPSSARSWLLSAWF